jgi:hypothetical protein
MVGDHARLIMELSGSGEPDLQGFDVFHDPIQQLLS